VAVRAVDARGRGAERSRAAFENGDALRRGRLAAKSDINWILMFEWSGGGVSMPEFGAVSRKRRKREKGIYEQSN
jgi:hypothetical protein